LHDSEENPRVNSSEGLFQVKEEQGERALVYFDSSMGMEVVNVADQVEKRIFSCPTFSEASLTVRKNSFLFHDEVKSSCNDPVYGFAKAGQKTNRAIRFNEARVFARFRDLE